MKKRIERAKLFEILVTISAIFIILGWAVLFLFIPILGIKESIKLILGLVYDDSFIIIGTIACIGAIIISIYLLYEKVIIKLAQKLSRKKVKIIKVILVSLITFILGIILLNIYLTLKHTDIMIVLSQAIIPLFAIEIVLIFLGLLYFTYKYTNKKIKDTEEQQ